MSDITQVRRLDTAAAFAAHLAAIGADLHFDAEVEVGDATPLAAPLDVGGRIAANRFAILPMEGWDGTGDGRPTDLVRRRWRRFGASGAGLIWGGEAVAVTPDGRANPNQLVLDAATVDDVAELRAELVAAHEQAGGARERVVVGLQLTHSGRFARPDGRPGRGPPTAIPFSTTGSAPVPPACSATPSSTTSSRASSRPPPSRPGSDSTLST